MTGTLPYAIPKDPGGGKGLLFAVLVHLLLLCFLWAGVSWKSDKSGGVEAEVWDLQYRESAPKPVKMLLPPPAPKVVVKMPKVKPRMSKPDIALAQKKKRLDIAKKKRLKREAAKKAAAEKRRIKQAAKEAKRRQELVDQKARGEARVEEMRRIMAAAGSGGRGTAAKTAGRLDASYAAKIRAKIRSNTVFVVPVGLKGNPEVEYAIKLMPDGTLRHPPRKVKASGIPGFDQAVARAIVKSVPFPRDKSGKVLSGFTIVHRPKD